jgi:uncharacterized protein (DUF2236 family)
MGERRRRVAAALRERIRPGAKGGALGGVLNGRPAWADAIEQGDDEGYFGPGSAAWAVHGGLETTIAGVRALLMQTLHPGAMAGVHDWSRYHEDPLGRLGGTIQWLVTVTFADRATAVAESGRVSRFHSRVVGTYRDAQEVDRPYAAGDQELLSWVHAVFADAFLTSTRIWGPPIPGGGDQYVREWATAAELLGIEDPPRSDHELRARLDGFRDRGILKSDDRVAEAVHFIRHPPLPKNFLPVYRVLFAAAVSSIPRDYRRLIGVRRSWWPARTVARVLLWVFRRLVGERSGAERAALERVAGLPDRGDEAAAA